VPSERSLDNPKPEARSLTDRYLHMLRFTCPHCGVSLKVTRIIDEPNDNESFLISCDACKRSSNVSGSMAKSHTITDLHRIIW
jgi:transcription elongation factor Elf1